MLKEIHHRVKNNMQVISSLVSLKADELRDDAMCSVLGEVSHRIRSMALVHEKLYQSSDLAMVEFDQYTKSLINYLWHAYGTYASPIQLTEDLEPVTLPVNAAVPCGLILNELVSNALKHAFQGRSDGEVTVSLKHAGQNRVRIGIYDNGCGLPEGLDWRHSTTLGLRLLQMLAGQLHADVDLTSDKNGTRVEIVFGQAG
jgi:two-component sensor histidine kinase